MPVDPHKRYIAQRRRQARFTRDVSRYRARKHAEYQAQVQVAAQRAAQQQQQRQQQQVKTAQVGLTEQQKKDVNALRSLAQSEVTTFHKGKKKVSKPDPLSYDYIKTDLTASKLETKYRLKNIRNAPEDALFKTAEGEKITRDTAIRRLQTQKRGLTSELSKVKSYEDQNYKIRQSTGGGIEFFKSKSQIKKEVINRKADQIARFYDKNKAGGAGHFVSSGFLSWEDPFSLKSMYHLAAGDKREALRTKAKASLDLDAALKQGVHVYALKSYTGPFATVGFSYAGGAGAHAAAGKATAVTTKAALSAAGQTGAKAAVMKASPYLLKAGMAAGGVAMGGLAVKDVAETYKRDPVLAGAKAVTFAGAMYGGYKGWKSVKGTKWSIGSRKQMARKNYYSKHPKGKYELDLRPYKKGVEVTNKTPNRLRQIGQRVKQKFERPYKMSKGQKKFAREFAKNPERFKVKQKPIDALEIINKKSGRSTKIPKRALNWSDPNVKIDVVRGGKMIRTKVSRLGIKAYKPGKEVGVATPKHFEKTGPRLSYKAGVSPKFKGVKISAKDGKLKTRPVMDYFTKRIASGRSPVVKTRGGKRIYDFGYLEMSNYKNTSKNYKGFMPGPDDIPTGKVPPVSRGMSFKGKSYNTVTGRWVDTPDAGISIPGGSKPKGSTGNILTGSKGGSVNIPKGNKAAVVESVKIPIQETVGKTDLAPVFPVSKTDLAPVLVAPLGVGINKQVLVSSNKKVLNVDAAGDLGGEFKVVNKNNLKPSSEVSFVLDKDFKQPVKEKIGMGRKFVYKGDHGLVKKTRDVPDTKKIQRLEGDGEIDLKEFYNMRRFQEPMSEVNRQKYNYQIQAQPRLLISGQGLIPDFDFKQNNYNVQDKAVFLDVDVDVKKTVMLDQFQNQKQRYRYARSFGKTAGEINFETGEFGGFDTPGFELDLWGDDLGGGSGIGAFGRSRKHPIRDVNIAALEIFTGKKKKKTKKSGRR